MYCRGAVITAGFAATIPSASMLDLRGCKIYDSAIEPILSDIHLILFDIRGINCTLLNTSVSRILEWGRDVLFANETSEFVTDGAISH